MINPQNKVANSIPFYKILKKKPEKMIDDLGHIYTRSISLKMQLTDWMKYFDFIIGNTCEFPLYQIVVHNY